MLILVSIFVRNSCNKWKRDIWVLIYEAMTPQCGRSVVQVLVVRVDVGVVIYEAMTPSVRGQWFRSWVSEWI